MGKRGQRSLFLKSQGKTLNELVVLIYARLASNHPNAESVGQHERRPRRPCRVLTSDRGGVCSRLEATVRGWSLPTTSNPEANHVACPTDRSTAGSRGVSLMWNLLYRVDPERVAC
jgi:hypothetical protein